MRFIFMAIGLTVVSAPALACVCSPPETELEKREIAGRIAREAVAIVDVEQVKPMDFNAMRGETYRVISVHLGKSPQTVELDRDFHRGPGGQVSLGTTSCDEIPPPGQRTKVVLFAAAGGKYRFGGTCDQYFINEVPGAMAAIRSARGERPGERG